MKTKTKIALLLSGILLLTGSSVFGYSVQKGDTLWKLANSFNTTIDKLVFDNNIKNPNLIYVGQELNINSEIQSFGSINFVAGGKYRLSGSGLGTSDVSITLDSFKTPDGVELVMATHFGEIGYATIEPGTSKKEFISFTAISQDGSTDKATLSGVTRGLQFTTPYTASSSLAYTHSGGSILIISNPPQLYNEFAIKKNAEDIDGLWTFSSTSIPRLDAYATPTLNYQLIPKKYADDLAIAGVSDGSLSVKGIYEMSTKAELEAGTEAGGTGAFLIVPNSYFQASSTATTSVPITNSGGKLDQGFLNLAENWAFTSPIVAVGQSFQTIGTSSLATTSIGYIDGQPGSLEVSGTTALATTTINGVNLSNVLGGTDTDASAYHNHGTLGYFSTSSTLNIDNVATSTDIVISTSGLQRLVINFDGSIYGSGVTLVGNTFIVNCIIDGVRATSTGAIHNTGNTTNGIGSVSLNLITNVLSSGSHTIYINIPDLITAGTGTMYYSISIHTIQ